MKKHTIIETRGDARIPTLLGDWEVLQITCNDPVQLKNAVKERYLEGWQDYAVSDTEANLYRPKDVTHNWVVNQLGQYELVN